MDYLDEDTLPGIMRLRDMSGVLCEMCRHEQMSSFKGLFRHFMSVGAHRKNDYGCACMLSLRIFMTVERSLILYRIHFN